MARLSIRVDLPAGNRLGPGKIALLERIAAAGSIAAAGRSMGMSYRRAWELVAALNDSFATPLVEARIGGRSGGHATLTPLGIEIVAEYRRIEADAARAVAGSLTVIQRAARPAPSLPEDGEAALLEPAPGGVATQEGE